MPTPTRGAPVVPQVPVGGDGGEAEPVDDRVPPGHTLTTPTSVPSASSFVAAASHSVRTSPSTGEKPMVGDHATLRGGRGSATPSSQSDDGMGSERRSVGCGPTEEPRASAASRTFTVMAPFTGQVGPVRGAARRPCRPRDGFEARQARTPPPGCEIEPPPSEPVAPRDHAPAAKASPAVPPDDPPAEWPSSHGLQVAPKVGFSVSPFHPSRVFVLPTTTQPAAHGADQDRVAGGQSGRRPRGRAHGVTEARGVPRSLHPDGMPAAGGSPRRHQLVDRRGVTKCGLADRHEGVHLRVQRLDAARERGLGHPRVDTSLARTRAARSATVVSRKSMDTPWDQ